MLRPSPTQLRLVIPAQRIAPTTPSGQGSSFVRWRTTPALTLHIRQLARRQLSTTSVEACFRPSPGPKLAVESTPAARPKVPAARRCWTSAEADPAT